MQLETLVDLIVTRVLSTLKESEKQASVIQTVPSVLILSDDSTDDDFFAIDTTQLTTHYNVINADMANVDSCELTQYTAIILRKLSISSLVKLATGCCDTPFTELTQKAILSGVRVIVPKQALALFRYQEAKAKQYYGMLREKLQFLCQSGLIICEAQELTDTVIKHGLNSDNSVKSKAGDSNTTPVKKQEKEMKAEQRLISEQYVKTKAADGITCLIVNNQNIITALSRDCARELGISFKHE